MIKLLVFDFNGTLIADTKASLAADNNVLKVFGGKPVTLKEYRDTIIVPSINFYASHGCNRKELENNSKKLGEVFHTYYEKRVSKIRSRRHARLVLKWLHDNNVRSVILSNHTKTGIEYQLKRLGLKEYVDKVLSNTELDSSMKTRNKEERLQNYIKSNTFKKSEIIIIGDSPEEVEIGQNTRVTTVAITNGYYSTKRLKKSNPDFLIDDLKELIKIVKG